jgi:hypothetical protein
VTRFQVIQRKPRNIDLDAPDIEDVLYFFAVFDP